jgi:hypothetical protein
MLQEAKGDIPNPRSGHSAVLSMENFTFDSFCKRPSY